MPSFGQDLIGRREGMVAYRRAMRQAMKLFPSVTHEHLLAQIDATIAALPDYHPAKDAWSDVVEFQRTNPDVLALAAPFGFDAAAIDDLFTVAMAIERGLSDTDAIALVGT